MYELIRMRAKITLSDTPNGRKEPFTSGYRPLFNFSDAVTRISGRIDLIDKDSFSVGMTDVVYLTFIKGMIEDTHFSSGVKFTFSEGADALGAGEILSKL